MSTPSNLIRYKVLSFLSPRLSVEIKELSAFTDHLRYQLCVFSSRNGTWKLDKKISIDEIFEGQTKFRFFSEKVTKRAQCWCWLSKLRWPSFWNLIRLSICYSSLGMVGDSPFWFPAIVMGWNDIVTSCMAFPLNRTSYRLTPALLTAPF